MPQQSYGSWITNQKDWSIPKLNGKFIPGIVEFSAIKIVNATKDNKKPGNAGGGIIMEGLINPKFSFGTKIMNAYDELVLRQRIPEWLSLASPKLSSSIPVYYPVLSLIGIVSCFICEVEVIPPKAGGFIGVIINCVGVTNGKPLASVLVTPSAGTNIKQSNTKLPQNQNVEESAPSSTSSFF